MNFFNFTNFFFLVLLAALIVSGGFLYWKSRKNKAKNMQQEAQFTLTIRNPHDMPVQSHKEVMRSRPRTSKAPQRKKKNHSVLLTEKEQEMRKLQKRALWIETVGNIAVCYIATEKYMRSVVKMQRIEMDNALGYLHAKTKPFWISRYEISEGSTGNGNEYVLLRMEEKGHKIPYRIFDRLQVGPIPRSTMSAQAL